MSPRRRRQARTRSSSSTPGSVCSRLRLREFVAPYSARVLEAAGVPTIHFGTGATTRFSRRWRVAGGSALGVDWRIPLDVAREIVGDARASRGISSRPAARPVGAGRVRRRSTSCAARAAGRATSSTSGTASSRRPIPTCSRGSRSWCAATVSRREERGRSHGVRLARAAHGRPRVLRRHPRRPPDRARASRRPRRALPAARHRGLLAAQRDHRADPRGARGASSACRSSPG